MLRPLRDGLSIPAVALEMHISHSTAKTYVARLYESLTYCQSALVIRWPGWAPAPLYSTCVLGPAWPARPGDGTHLPF